MESTPHILIVDDDREIRDLLSRFLTRNGLRVSVAREEREMRKVLQDAAIDPLDRPVDAQLERRRHLPPLHRRVVRRARRVERLHHAGIERLAVLVVPRAIERANDPADEGRIGAAVGCPRQIARCRAQADQQMDRHCRCRAVPHPIQIGRGNSETGRRVARAEIGGAQVFVHGGVKLALGVQHIAPFDEQLGRLRSVGRCRGVAAGRIGENLELGRLADRHGGHGQLRSAMRGQSGRSPSRYSRIRVDQISSRERRNWNDPAICRPVRKPRSAIMASSISICAGLM